MKNGVVVITGASSGIGKSTAEYLSKKGFTVYALARRMDKLEDLIPLGIKPLFLDVTNETSIKVAIEEIYEAEGRIDVLFNNAGYGLYGPIEDVDLKDARDQFEVNLFGLANMIKHVLPIMRKQGSGKIINTSSIGGKVASLLGGWYHASKFALEGFSDSLRIELKQFGIQVVLIQPGLIKTEFMQRTYDYASKIDTTSPYQNTIAHVMKSAERDYLTGKVGSNPLVVAKVVYKAIRAKRPKTRYRMGTLSFIALTARKILPDKWLDYILLKR
ncbi:SDR family NAD(P)-dependent oxidoreductase [Acholeplasma laidlawii]|nr:SDR family NAD(P)-dependent oxidoreductase [Acholeplasma laidlawii]NWH11543.1 SDR family NAD(P)-dependent oxidoreductase [Acholeplasma laidlawii]NWH13047.1 SDR family NAD(P)-dependent oxidoreductase [Acholeplasma laidlawii]NWH14685.1 SDR family NAD(P)-dependent oxidoreductase [Acholeplasma laidlawii]OED26868.1 short-chain dehydrogenase/reductase [Acholeplasma laidlawii]